MMTPRNHGGFSYNTKKKQEGKKCGEDTHYEWEREKTNWVRCQHKSKAFTALVIISKSISLFRKQIEQAGEWKGYGPLYKSFGVCSNPTKHLFVRNWSSQRGVHFQSQQARFSKVKTFPPKHGCSKMMTIIEIIVIKKQKKKKTQTHTYT